jgi:membrane-associated phospholipid phosphatase
MDAADHSIANRPLYKEVWRCYRYYFGMREFRLSFLYSLAALAASYGVMLFAIRFATENASNSVTDLILSNIPVFDVDSLFVYGTFLLIAMIVLLCIVNPKRIPYTLYSIALFWLIRSGFTTLTHIAPFEAHMGADFGSAIARNFFGGDLFFSGHAGAPFLLALLYWRDRWLRYLFLAWSVFFAVIVLLGHLHYSIDVASAFFITYTIFCIAQWLFPKSRALFYSEMPANI